MLQALPTTYRGIEFRARCEARWAVFFDKLGLRYIYEPLKVSPLESRGYLPDFFFPEWRIYGEVKDLKRETLTFDEIRKILSLVHALQVPLLLFDGGPHRFELFLLAPENTRTVKEYSEMDGDDSCRLEDFRMYLPDVARCSIAWLPLDQSYALVNGYMQPDTTPDRAIEKALEYAQDFTFTG